MTNKLDITTNSLPSTIHIQSLDLTLRLHNLQTAQLPENPRDLSDPCVRIVTRASEPSLTSCRTSERKGRLLSLLYNTIPPAHARELTCLPQILMTDKSASSIHSKCLSEPCAQDHHAYHGGIQHSATENFRAQQEPSLQLSVPRTRLHLLRDFPGSNQTDRPIVTNLCLSSREISERLRLISQRRAVTPPTPRFSISLYCHSFMWIDKYGDALQNHHLP